MATKRSRTSYEADLRAKQSPYVVYGTPLPPYDPDSRDDGSYVPVWKQEVTDERGRKRLHGAFTGGFSAGYFNTVGSKEGWTPSTFVSSRSNRKKDDPKAPQKRPEDFMDDEDLAEAEAARQLQTADGFSGLGSTEGDALRRGNLMGLFKTQGETMGVKLLKKMGWKEGQGVGPKVKRAARLDGVNSDETLHLFAPEDTKMIGFVKKDDHKGLGFEGQTRLGDDDSNKKSQKSQLEDEEDEDEKFGTIAKPKPKKKPARGGIGIGILNDTGSDDEDPYEIGPRISYNKTIGGDKKKKKKLLGSSANPTAAVRPVFISKKAALAKAAVGFRKCHDGRLPLDSFILSSDSVLSEIVNSDGKHPPPSIPEGWKSAKQPTSDPTSASYTSTAEAAKASTLDPKSRAALLGEASLPGKSVFDFLSSSARDRIASASGRSNLPAALGEIPAGYALTPAQKAAELLARIPKLDREVAVAALARGTTGWMPYAEDEGKRSRYRAYLELQAGLTTGLPPRLPNSNKEDWLKELQEFANCAQLFKPMSGMMATRFAPSSGSTNPSTPTDASTELLHKPERPEDPAEAAAKVGMFGPLTRSVVDFYPSRLLCKRFNVKPPVNVQLDPEQTGGAGPGAEMDSAGKKRDLELIKKGDVEDIMKMHWDGVNSERKRNRAGDSDGDGDVNMEEQETVRAEPVVVDVERNEALEGERASAAVFAAVFGDSDEE